MKSLCSKLISLVPHSTTKEMSSIYDQLNGAKNYIEELQTRVEKLKKKKKSLLEPESLNTASSLGRTSLTAPEIIIQEVGMALEVVLISNKLGSQLIFNEIVRVLHEEGAEVLNANLAVIGDIAFHSIHSEVEDTAGNNNIRAAAKITERLKNFLYSC